MAALFMLQPVLHSLQLHPSPVTNQGTIGALQPKCGSLVAALFMLQSVPQSLQLYPVPVPIKGLLGPCSQSAAALWLHHSCCKGLAAGVCLVHCIGIVCGALCVVLVACVCGPLFVSRRVWVYTARAQRTPSLHSEWWLSTGCPAFLALLTHHVGMVPPTVGFGTTSECSGDGCWCSVAECQQRDGTVWWFYKAPRYPNLKSQSP